MGPACNMGKIDPPTSIDRPVILDESEKRAQRLCELSDALAAVALELDADVQRSSPIVGALWGKMDAPNPVDALLEGTR